MIEYIDSKMEKHIKVGDVDYFITTVVEKVFISDGTPVNTISLSVYRDNMEEDIEDCDPEFTVVVNKLDMVDMITLFNEIIRGLHVATGVSIASTPVVPTPAATRVPTQIIRQ